MGIIYSLELCCEVLNYQFRIAEELSYMGDADKAEEKLIDELMKPEPQIEDVKNSVDFSRILFEYSSDAYCLSDSSGNFVYVNSAFEEITGYKNNELVGKDLMKLGILRENFLKQPTGPDEIVLKRKGGSEVSLEIRTFPIKSKDISLVLCIARDITDQKRNEKLLRIQRDLGIALSATTQLDEALRLCLEAAISASEMDCGGIYLVDGTSGVIDLAYHKGLPPEFIEMASHYEADSYNASLVMQGKPIYTQYRKAKDPIVHREGLRAIAIIPVRYEDSIVACLNIASHRFDEVPDYSRIALEAISTQIGSTIVRLKTEEELRENEANLHTLFNSLEDFLFVLDANGCILRINPVVVNRLDYSEKELIGKGVSIVHPPHLREEADLIVADILNGKRDSCPIPLMTKDGTHIPVETKLTRGRWSGQDVLFGVSRDITERKLAEKALQESEGRIRELAEFLPQTLFEMDIAGNFTYSNRCGFETFGYTQEDFEKGLNVFQLLIPEDREKAVQNIRKRLMGEEFKQYEYTGLRKDGSTFPLLIYSSSIIRDNKTVGVRGIVLDITERKNAEEALQQAHDELESRVIERTTELSEANQRLREEIAERKQTEEELASTRQEWENIFQAIGHPTLILDPEHKIISANRAALKAISKTEQELFGRKCYEFFHDSEASPEDCPMVKMLSSGHLEAVEMEVEALNGTFLVSCTPVLNDKGHIQKIIHIATDITELKKMENELLKIEKLESIGVLAGGIAHDLNNLLTGVVGNISLAMIYKDLEQKDKRLSEAEKASMRIKDLTQQLLTFSKGGAPVLSIVAIEDLLRDSASFALTGTNVICEFSIPDDLWMVEVDMGQISQVINNLVINAQQAMPEGGVVKVSSENIIVDAESSLPLKQGTYVKVSVEDHGIGISHEHLRRIFDPFFTTKQQGSGLGLATSFSIIQKHNGYITAESQLGVGSTFYIYLPAFSEQITTEERMMEDKPVTGEGRILVMDDEDYVRELAAKMLTSIGYEVVTAIDGTDAIKLYKEAMESGNSFDAAIVDLTVAGGMGGAEAIQRLVEIDPEVKAIVSSGYSNDPVLADFGKYGFKGVIAKPYKLIELSQILHRVVNKGGKRA